MRTNREKISLAEWIVCGIAAMFWTTAFAEELKRDPTPQDYVERNGGGASVVPPGQLMIDRHRLTCGQWATVLDPNLDDYAASYPRFVILNMPHVGKEPTPVKLWIFNHECGHLYGKNDESEADCFAVRRGLSEGWLTEREIDDICGFIAKARPDATHPGGNDRCALMRGCFRLRRTISPLVTGAH